jgi:hypothetical protein
LVVFFTVRLAIARNNAQATAARLQRVQQFMLNLFQGGDKNAGPAADLKVVSLLDRGVKEAQALQREPEVQAELYLTLGGIYRKLGKLNEADEPSLERTIRRFPTACLRSVSCESIRRVSMTPKSSCAKAWTKSRNGVRRI